MVPGSSVEVLHCACILTKLESCHGQLTGLQMLHAAVKTGAIAAAVAATAVSVRQSFNASVAAASRDGLHCKRHLLAPAAVLGVGVIPAVDSRRRKDVDPSYLCLACNVILLVAGVYVA